MWVWWVVVYGVLVKADEWEDLLSKRRKVREEFAPRGICKGAIKIEDEEGKKHFVNSTELNVNVKPVTIELLGKISKDKISAKQLHRKSRIFLSRTT